ncbi:MAG TPA: hypothetical protein VIS09_00105 [Streptomyces sp.]
MAPHELRRGRRRVHPRTAPHSRTDRIVVGYEDAMRLLADRYRLYAVDLRGRG